MVSVESSIVATAVPSVVAAVGGFEYVSWVFAAYLLAQAVSIPIYGRLADLWGRKWLLIGSTALFLLGTVLCSVAWGMIPLVIFRFIQGVGAGGLQPLALTIIGDLYPPVERVKVQGNLNAIWGVSALSGPLIGAVLTETLGWRSVFWINVFRPVKETLKIFSMCPEVHMEDADLQRPVVIRCKYGLLDGVHATDR